MLDEQDLHQDELKHHDMHQVIFYLLFLLILMVNKVEVLIKFYPMYSIIDKKQYLKKQLIIKKTNLFIYLMHWHHQQYD